MARDDTGTGIPAPAGDDLSSFFARWDGCLEGNEDLELLGDLAAEPWDQEFFWSPHINPEFIAACAASGFLPMATRVLDEQGGMHEVLTPKFHHGRCAVLPGEFRMPSSVLSRARGRIFTVNRDFPQVLEACAKTHGDEWLTPKLQESLLSLHDRRHVAGGGPAFISAEIQGEAGLVAGEIGYVCGSIYTSMTGWHSASGSGSLQLHCLGKQFFSHGMTVWDLGMDMPYKRDLGGRVFDRRNFSALRRGAKLMQLDWQSMEGKSIDCRQLLGANQ